MVLQFKVWRLKNERYVTSYSHVWKGKRKTNKRVSDTYGYRLVLRDKSGRIRKVAYTKEDKLKLRQWYEKYNRQERFDQLFKAREINEQARKIKAKIRKRGFKHQISFYGLYKNPKTEKKEYHRYEVFKADPFTQADVKVLHDLFKKNVPKSPAGLYMWHNSKLYVDQEDTLTRGTMLKQQRIDQT